MKQTSTTPAVRTNPPLKQEELFPGARVLSLVLITLAALVAVAPLLYMVSLAFQSDAEVAGGRAVLWPEQMQWGNIARLFEAAPFGRFFFNSVLVAGLITCSHLIFAPVVAYAFAKFDFPGKQVFFILILSTMMIPFFVRMIPLYVWFSQIGWLDTYQGLVTPFLMSAFSIFLMRQFIAGVPNELIEAGRVDGAGELRIYRSIVLPQTKPALVVLGLFTFVFQMNEFLWPLIVTKSDAMRTITIGLSLFNRESFTLWNLTAMGSLMLFVPVCLLFVLTQKHIVQGIAMTGIK
ncbi:MULTISPECIES: carbohydrate ABC transporter permease [Actinomyces]|uniref:Carbohydrate ABC transporter permease n=1 Tax=Actinomyces respiraculi TaxID=2744574 RepID=A0A7T0PWM3_9ACTO|nr:MULTISPECIES: carbohydrate ABC transporter permease [Actinomyces]QPL04690.1 carbohydrate ABC transporter permease [Actinomyces respiraculi]